MKTIVLIPGYMCDDQIWINQLTKLKKKYKVIIPSLKRGKTIKNNIIKPGSNTPWAKGPSEFRLWWDAVVLPWV